MATCKDCIHYDVCVLYGGFIVGQFVPNCKHFKNKADVIEVVRCKDCNNCEMLEDVYYCNHFNKNVEEDDYCSYGG